jgi:hypothetical protein
MHEEAAEGIGVFGVPIEDEVSLAAKEPIVDVREIACHLRHPGGARVRGDASDVHGACRNVDEE